MEVKSTTLYMNGRDEEISKALVVKNVLHMNPGDGENSYANNSILQRTVIIKARPFLEEAIENMFSSNFSNCFKVADLGCSSGPNTLLTISEIIDVVDGLCQPSNRKFPEFQFFLNDLPGNDFNNIFKSLPSFYDELYKEKGEGLGPIFVLGMPGSFYGRLFPSKSLHFVHSSYSLMWLSQVPDGLSNNKGNIYMAKTSPPEVFEAYKQQFERDFLKFLNVRCEELVSGGRMLLTFIGRSVADPSSKDCCYLWELLTKSLFDLVSQGLIEEADIDTYNMPLYTPFKEQVRTLIQKQGSFNLDRLETFESNWDGNDHKSDEKDFIFDQYETGRAVSNIIRATQESILASHFGRTIIDDLFSRFTEHVAQHLSSVEKTKHVNLVISLTKK